eukprot:9453794-Lingulodinium_polyedra.AAC.1
MVFNVVHWYPMVFHVDVMDQWFSTVFNALESMVFNGFQWCSMVLNGCSMGVQWCSMVLNGAQGCSMVFNGVQWCSM